MISSNILIFNNWIHIHIESACDSFYRLPRNTFRPPKHDNNNMQIKDTDEEVGSSKHQVWEYTLSSQILIFSVPIEVFVFLVIVVTLH